MILYLWLVVACGDRAENLQQTGRKTTPRNRQNQLATSPAVEPTRKPIPLFYVVDSYNSKAFRWTREINEGIVKGLERGGFKNGINYRLFSSSIDAFVNDTPEKMEAQAQRILEDIERRQPDLVFTTDDDALVWVGLKLGQCSGGI